MLYGKENYKVNLQKFQCSRNRNYILHLVEKDLPKKDSIFNANRFLFEKLFYELQALNICLEAQESQVKHLTGISF